MSIYIITPCSRIQHLSQISKTIPDECIWVVVYDSNHNDEILPYGDIIFRPKNITGGYGKPHINYALDNLKLTDSDWVYVLDDDNIIHPNWYENVKPFCNNNHNILSWGQLWNDNSMRLRPTEHMVFAEKLGQNSFCINKYLCYYNYLSSEYFTQEEKLEFDRGVLSYLLSKNIFI